MSRIEIRTLTAHDWDAVRSIYLDGLATGQATFETQAPSWADWDSAHLPVPRLVATSEGRVLGWAALSPVSSRAVYAGVAEVSVYVDKDSRGQGVGKSLLGALIDESEKNGIWTLQASIFPENAASIVLHKALDFCVVGRRERIGKRNGVWRDTLLLERRSKLVGSE
jgi:phosphinothricin acetyltransferase